MSKTERFVAALAVVATVMLMLIALQGKALALDCQHATQLLDKVICEDSDLKAADAKMAKAYFDLLKSTKDKEVHDLIILSQRRWIDARYHQHITDPHANPEPDTDVLDTQKSMLLDQMIGRAGAFSVRPSTMELNIKEEREFNSKFSGGLFSGFRTGCFFAPEGFGDGAYICVGTQVAQNNDRICTTIQDWASGHETEYRTVSQVADGKAKLIAECSTGYASTDETCPDTEAQVDAAVGWNFHPDPKDSSFDPNAQDGPSLKLDPDFPFDDISHGWTAQCLTDPNFPPRSQESSASRNQ